MHIYPVKGCGGLSLAESEVTPRGFRYDRRWMFVDERGMFVAQRDGRSLGVSIPAVCLVRTAIDARGLTLAAPSMPSITVPFDRPGVEVPVTVWDDRFTAIDQGDDAEAWATTLLSRHRPGRYRLVRMSDNVRRSPRIGDGSISFSDAYSFLVIADTSLTDLNTRLDAPLPMNRFRPNIVITGAAPYAEDAMDRFRIGAVEFHGTTLCIRCPTTTTNQDTAERGKEPLRTLATYRRQPDGVFFGRNFNHSGVGVVKVGDVLTV